MPDHPSPFDTPGGPPGHWPPAPLPLRPAAPHTPPPPPAGAWPQQPAPPPPPAPPPSPWSRPGAGAPPPGDDFGSYGGYSQGTYGGYRGYADERAWPGSTTWRPPPPTPPGRSGRTRKWVVLLGLGTVLVVVAAVAVVVLPDRGPPHPDQWDPRVADLAAFVEGERGLEFAHPVYVDFLTDAEYSDAVRVDQGDVTAEARDEMESTVATLRALGLASGDVDLFEAGNDLVDDGTLAFYHPGTERITVRGTELTVDLKVTLVHEMTHALQDQHFDLDALQQEIFADVDPAAASDPGSDEDGEAALAESAANAAFSGYQALVEGDAVRIENAYVESLSDADAEAYRSSYQEGLDQAETELGEVPAALRAFQAIPYVLGQPLVDLIAADGGNTGVDDMFDDPPTTEEHLLYPLAYLHGAGPSELPLPNPADAEIGAAGEGTAEVIDRGTMGAVELFIVLAERIDPLVALDAADGWANATFTSFDIGDRTCVRVLVDGDTPADDQQLRSALGAWVAGAPAESNASVENLSAERTQVESCDPGTGGAPGNERALDVLTVPAVRSQMTFFAVDAGADLDSAWAAGNCFVHQLTFDQMVTINELTTEPPPELQALIDGAFETCAP